MQGRISTLRIRSAVAVALSTLPCLVLAAEPVSSVPSVGGYTGKIVFSLLLIIGLMMALAWFTKRFNFPGLAQRNNGEIEALAQLNLGPRERVMLLQVGSDQVLVSVVPGEIRRLMVMRNRGDNRQAAEEFAAALAAERAAQPEASQP